MALVVNTVGTSAYTNNPQFPGMNTQAASYTPTIQDANQIIEFSAAGTLTVPPNASVPFPIGTTLTVMAFVTGAAAVAVAPGSGVTIRARGAFAHLNNQYSVGYLTQVRLNEWYFSGDIVA